MAEAGFDKLGPAIEVITKNAAGIIEVSGVYEQGAREIYNSGGEINTWATEIFLKVAEIKLEGIVLGLNALSRVQLGRPLGLRLIRVIDSADPESVSLGGYSGSGYINEAISGESRGELL